MNSLIRARVLMVKIRYIRPPRALGGLKISMLLPDGRRRYLDLGFGFFGYCALTRVPIGSIGFLRGSNRFLRVLLGFFGHRWTRKDVEGPGWTRTYPDGPGWTGKDLDGPGRTPTDLYGPGRTRKDLEGPRRT